jgi:hypothetical protein
VSSRPQPRRRRPRDHGQSSLEWLGIVLLVSFFLALGAGLAQADAVGRRVTREMARALCLVSGGDCRRDQEPCVVDSDELRRQTETGFLIWRLRHDEYSLIAHRSDGTYAVTLTKGNEVGVELSLGLKAGVHGHGIALSAGAELTASLRASLPNARTWFVRNADEVNAVVETGGAWRPPDETSVDFNALGDLGLSLGADALRHLKIGSADFSFDARVGTVTDHRTGARRLYVTADGAASANALVLGSVETHDASEVYTVEISPAGRPIALTITSTGALDTSRDLPAIVQPVAGRLAAPGARRYEVTAALDLTEPAALAAAAGLLDAIAHKHALAEPSAALRRLIETTGTVEARVLSAEDKTESSFGADATLLAATLKLDHLQQRRDEALLAAVSRGLDGQWIAREDCVA